MGFFQSILFLFRIKLDDDDLRIVSGSRCNVFLLGCHRLATRLKQVTGFQWCGRSVYNDCDTEPLLLWIIHCVLLSLLLIVPKVIGLHCTTTHDILFWCDFKSTGRNCSISGAADVSLGSCGVMSHSATNLLLMPTYSLFKHTEHYQCQWSDQQLTWIKGAFFSSYLSYCLFSTHSLFEVRVYMQMILITLRVSFTNFPEDLCAVCCLEKWALTFCVLGWLSLFIETPVLFLS